MKGEIDFAGGDRRSISTQTRSRHKQHDIMTGSVSNEHQPHVLSPSFVFRQTLQPYDPT